MDNIDVTLLEYLKLRFLVVLPTFLIPYVIVADTFTGFERQIADPNL